MADQVQESGTDQSAPSADDERTVVVSETPDGAEPDPDTLAPGTRLSRYRIVEVLGAGGMGSVYLAHDPSLDREVALKLLRGSAQASDQERERLLREGQALAAINHPNVISIFDAGESPLGVFLAMERLEGQDLRAWRDTNPNTSEALEVYLAAAEGLAAAHQAGLVHRDFKPGNVMLTPTGRVVVLDFGLVQAEGLDSAALADAFSSVDRSSERSANSDARLTRTGTVMGTPAYMAPEQRLGKPVDARSDQFAFCVSLYEALAGRRPYDFAPLNETRAKEIRPPVSGRSIPSGIASVLARGLSVEPQERWASMDALAHALRRARRQRVRRLGTLAAAAGVMGVIGLMAIPAAPTDDAPAMQCDAQASLAEVWNDEASTRMASAMRSSSVPYHEAAYDHAARSIDEWGQKWQEARRRWCAAQRSPEVRTAIGACLDSGLERLTFTVTSLSDGTPKSVERAPALVGLLDPPSRCEELEGRASLADADVLVAVQAIEAAVERAEGLVEVDRRDDARAILDDAIAQAKELGRSGPHALAMAELGRIEERDGNFDRAIEMYERGYSEAAAAPRDDLSAELAIRAASLYYTARADREGTERWLRHAEAALERRPDDRIAAHLLRTRYRLVEDKQPEAALALLAQERKLLHKLEDEVGLIFNDLNRGGIEYELGKYEEALELTAASLARLETIYGAEHPTVARVLVNLSTQQVHAGQAEDGLQSLERALAILRQADDRKALLFTLQNYAIMLRDFERYDEAAERFEEARTICLELYGPDHPLIASIESATGQNFAEQGDFEEAERWIQSALETRRRVLGEDHPELSSLYVRLANLERDRGRLDEAVVHFERAMQIVRDSVGVDDSRYGLALYGRGISRRDQGKLREAKADLEQALRIERKAGGQPEGIARSLFVLARLYWDEGRHDEARSMVDEAATLTKGMPGRLPRRIEQWRREH